MEKESKEIQKKFKTRLEVNLEKIPFIFFTNYKNKSKIENKILSSKGGIEVYFQKLLNGTIRSIKLDVSMSYGLPISEDQDVWTVVSHKISEYQFKHGKCPETLDIEMNEFAELMKKKISGAFYKNVEDSLQRLAGVTLFHEQCFLVKSKDKKKKEVLEYDEKKGIKIINSLLFLHIRSKKKGKGSREKKIVRIEIPGWLQDNYNSYYTTSLDIDLYFKLTKGRTRRLYRLLDVFRYNNGYFLDYNRCDSVLFLNEIKQRFKRNEKIKIALKALKKEGYLTDYAFEDYGIEVKFKNIKKGTKRVLQRHLSENEEDILQNLINYLNEPQSENMFRSIIKKYRPSSIVHCLDMTKEAIKNEGVKKSKGAIFMYFIKKYGKKFEDGDIALEKIEQIDEKEEKKDFSKEIAELTGNVTNKFSI